MATAGAAADREGHPEERGEGGGEVEETDQGTAHQGEGQEDIREGQRYFMIPQHCFLYDYVASYDYGFYYTVHSMLHGPKQFIIMYSWFHKNA